MDLTSIRNYHEFYTHHYLSAILEQDLREVFERWAAGERERGIRPPHERLDALARPWARMKADLARQDDEKERLETQREFMDRLLDELGYPVEPAWKPAGAAVEIFVRGAIGRPNGQPLL